MGHDPQVLVERLRRYRGPLWFVVVRPCDLAGLRTRIEADGGEYLAHGHESVRTEPRHPDSHRVRVWCVLATVRPRTTHGEEVLVSAGPASAAWFASDVARYGPGHVLLSERWGSTLRQSPTGKTG
jgi:hypothetical protein